MTAHSHRHEREAPAGVVHCRSREADEARAAGTYVYIGRPSKWGNPFRIGPDGDRETVLRKYEAWLTKLTNGRFRTLYYDATDELSGKVLGCWCAPERCHGDVLMDVMSSYWHRLWSS